MRMYCRQAEVAFLDALLEYTRDRAPMNWAMNAE